MANPVRNGSMASDSKILPCITASISFTESVHDAVPQISDAATEANLRQAAMYIKQGRLVAFPTETVYGLGGSAMADSQAIPKIFATKGRPSDNPLIVHIASRNQLDSLVDPAWRAKLPICYTALMDKFWPGPLTLLFPTVPGKQVSEKVTCQLKTVGVRMPSHPVARALLAISYTPLAAPSANTSGRPSTTQARHVALDLAGKAEPACILDGGDCTVGVESTVVSALPEGDHIHNKDQEMLRVLRLGGISPEDLRACLDEAGLSDKVALKMQAYSPSQASPTNGTNGHSQRDDFTPTTPGMKYKHYSPDAKVILVKNSNSAFATSVGQFALSLDGQKVGVLYLEGSPLKTGLQKHLRSASYISFGRQGRYEEQAKNLFSSLRDLDEEHVDVILVEAVQEEGLGRTVMERLRKSAGGSAENLEIRTD